MLVRVGRLRSSKPGGGLVLPNLLRNSSLVGANAGPPDVLPTYWAMTTPREGAVRDIVGLGTDAYPYLDVDWAGNSTGAASTVLGQFDSNFAIAAAPGDVHTGAATLTLRSGSFANVTAISLRIRYLNAGGSTLASTIASVLGMSGSPSRYAVTSGAAPVDTAWVVFELAKAWAASGVVGFGLRIEGVMLNSGAVAAPFQPTSP